VAGHVVIVLDVECPECTARGGHAQLSDDGADPVLVQCGTCAEVFEVPLWGGPR
jgi:hypothetical protein